MRTEGGNGMRRMMLWIVPLLLVACTPAFATHVNEPTSPITGMTLRVKHYGTGTIVPCDGSVFGFNDLRIEQFVTFTDMPSEHFDARVEVMRFTFNPNRLHRLWDLTWKHSNVPPHEGLPAKNRWKATGDRTNTYDLIPGTYRIIATLDTLASLQHFEAACDFVIPEGLA